jgi:hypothetical protein
LGYESVCLDRPMIIGASGLCRDNNVGVFRFLTSFGPGLSHCAVHSPHICHTIYSGGFLSFRPEIQHKINPRAMG